MSKYLVTIPIAGHVSIAFEASTQEEAKSKALEECDSGNVSWEALEDVNTGSMCNAPTSWEIQIDEL